MSSDAALMKNEVCRSNQVDGHRISCVVLSEDLFLTWRLRQLQRSRHALGVVHSVEPILTQLRDLGTLSVLAGFHDKQHGDVVCHDDTC